MDTVEPSSDFNATALAVAWQIVYSTLPVRTDGKKPEEAAEEKAALVRKLFAKLAANREE